MIVSGSSSNLKQVNENFKKLRTNSQASLSVIAEEDKKKGASKLSINLANVGFGTKTNVEETKVVSQSKIPKVALKSKEDIGIGVKRVSGMMSPKSPSVFSSGARFAQYMLVFPQKQTLDEIRQEDLKNMKRSFYSFRTIIDKKTERIGEEKTKELFSEFTSMENLKTQLDYNKEQERMFLRTAESKFFDTNSKLGKVVGQKETAVKKMPLIRVKTSNRYPEPPKILFEGENSPRPSILQEDENKTFIKFPRYLNYRKFRPNDYYNFHWRIEIEEDSTAWKPHVVEGASFAINGRHGFLYGGRSKDVNNNLAILDLTNWTWERAPASKDAPQFGRSGHSANFFKKYMVIFGGVKNYNVLLNARECLGDIHFYNTETNNWRYVQTAGDFVEARRYHVGVSVGKHLLIHGGINSSGQYLGDLKIFGFINHRWTSYNDFDDSEDTEGIAFHAACLVVHDQRRDFDLFRLHSFQPDGNSPVIKEEGIYFFGGRYSDESSSNTLKILKIGQERLRWIKPATLGQPPLARYLHTMVHCSALNMLVVYGGRNNDVYSNKLSPVLEDFYTLQLDTLTWVAVRVSGIYASGRCAHISGVAGTNLIIFGGINFNVYCKSELNIIEMNQSIVNKIVRHQEQSKNVTEVSEAVVTNSPSSLLKTKEDSLKKIRTQSLGMNGITSFLPLPSGPSVIQLKSAGPSSPKTLMFNNPPHSLSARRFKTGSFGGN